MPEPSFLSVASSVQSPESSVQSPTSRVQSPASRVQRPESSVQSLASNSCVQSLGISVCPSRKLSPSQLKGLPTGMYFLEKVDVYLKHFISTGVKLFHWEKSSNECRRQHAKSSQKVHKWCTKNCTKSSFIILFMSVITLLLVSFLCYLIISVIKDFFIIKILFQILRVFVLLYKDKLKVQHESATYLLCNMLHFYVALFQGRS